MPSKSFWPRELIFASPNPHTLPGGQQINKAPMCPCSACWDSPVPAGQQYVKEAVCPCKSCRNDDVSPVPSKTAAPSKTPKTASSTSWRKQILSGNLKRRGSFESTASLKPLHEAAQESPASTDADSVYSVERYQ